MMRVRAALVAALSLTVLLAGCADDNDPTPGSGDAEVAPAGAPGHTVAYTAHSRVAQAYNVTGDYSHTRLAGPYGILPGAGHFVSVELPVTEGGAAVLDPLNGPRVHLGLFLPDIPGCDWAAGALTAACHVPVIADVGPYYMTSTGLIGPNGPEGDTIATEPAHRLGGFLIDNFVPHGFAVAQVSVFGSGDSNHCFDMFGHAEQLGVDAAVTWLGTQAWSNGNVALIGRSYDGSTPWMAASFGNPHLATIVPISGLTGLQDLVTRNGTSEARVATFQNVVYGQFEVDGDAGDIQAVCPDAVLAAPYGAGALVTGDTVTPVDGTYWEERQFFPRVLSNYDGSVYFIHGLQDWNVDPHIITPHFAQLREKGLDVKGLFGQWGHMYPDRPGEHETLPAGRGAEAYPQSVRYDWAEDLFEWFTYYLKETGPKPVLKVEVQDNIGRWRIEDDFPPTDITELEVAIPGPSATVSAAGSGAVYDLGVVSATSAVAFSGHMYLEASVTPTGADGQIHYTVRDADSGLRLAFGTLAVRQESLETPILVPTQRVLARVQSQPFDFVLTAGHRLELTIAQTGDGLLPNPLATPMTFDPAQSRLLLPQVDRPASAYFTPPAWDGTRGDDAPSS